MIGIRFLTRSAMIRHSMRVCSLHSKNALYKSSVSSIRFSGKVDDSNVKVKSSESINFKTSLSYEELCDELERSDIVLFDVRNVEEVRINGCIPGAINIPSEEFKKLYGLEKPKCSNDNVIFYGLSDVSAASACQIAHIVGYKKSKYYANGWKEWNSLKSGKADCVNT